RKSESVAYYLHLSHLIVIVAIANEFSTARPKFRAVNSKRWKHDFVLHVTRTECLIVIVNDCDGVLGRRHGKQLTIWRFNDLTIVLQTREKIFEERIVDLAALRMILNPKHERLISQADLFDNVIGRAPSFDNKPLA